MPISLEVKDVGIEQAAIQTINLIRKYDRYASTAVGSESLSLVKKMVKIDPKICTIMDMTDVLLMIFGYFLGLLPYIKFERDLAAFPYMTDDFWKMKKEERRLS